MATTVTTSTLASFVMNMDGIVMALARGRCRPCPREPALSTGARARELRVLIVTDQYEPMVGGVPTVTRDLAAGLSGRGHAVAVVARARRGRGTGPTG